jgi:integrase
MKMTQNNSCLTRRGNRIYKKTPTSKRWMFLKQVSGKRYYFPLSPVISESKSMADEIDAFSLLNSIEDTVARFRPNGRRVFGENKPVPSIDEIAERFKSLAPSELGISKETIKSYIIAFKSLMQLGTGKTSSRLSLADLDDFVISEFKRKKLEGIEDEDRIKSVKRTINGKLRGARSMFSEDAMKIYADWNVERCSVLKSASMYKRVKKSYRLPPPDLVRRTFDLLESYYDQNSDRYIALALALHFGLRRNEILNSRRDWIEFPAKQPEEKEERPARIAVFTERKFLVKAGEDGYASGSPAIAKRILEQSSTFDYLLSTKCKRGAFDNLLKDLRSIGWDREKPLHECRKLYGSYFATTKNLYFAQKNLRHASAMTTNDFYTDLMDDSSILNLWAA